MSNDYCEPEDSCTVDPSSITVPDTEAGGVLLIAFKGSYLTWDHSDSAVELSRAMLAIGKPTTLFLKEDGVLMGKKGQQPQDNMESLGSKLKETAEYNGRVLICKESMRQRGLTSEDFIDGLDVVDPDQLYREIMIHETVLTF